MRCEPGDGAAVAIVAPRGRGRVVRKKNFVAPETGSMWCAWIEIPGHQFLLRGRRFSDPMVFSSNSRFFAATEFTGGLQHYYRVVVFDFTTDRQTIAHEERPERPEDLGIISSLRWAMERTSTFGRQ